MTKQNMTKANVTKMANQIVAKATSWKQVCKQLSGINEYVNIGNEKVTVHDAFILLGVHTKKNVYTPNGIALVWSERLKEKKPLHEGEDRASNSGWRAPLISKALTATITVSYCGKQQKFKLFELDTDTNDYVPVKVRQLCRVVKAEDKKAATDVMVSAKVVLEGLVQSVYIDDTINELKESQSAFASRVDGYVNVGKATAPVWRKVEKGANGEWSFTKNNEVVSVDVTTK